MIGWRAPGGAGGEVENYIDENLYNSHQVTPINIFLSIFSIQPYHLFHICDLSHYKPQLQDTSACNCLFVGLINIL